MRTMYRLLAILALALLLPPTPSVAGERLMVGVPLVSPGWNFDQFQDVLRAAYADMDVAVEFTHLPLRRDLVEADGGAIDGCLGRSRRALSSFPDLVTVPTPIARVSVCAFTLDPAVKADVPADLAGRKVGILYGNVMVEHVASRAGLRILAYDSIATAMRILRRGRLDAVLAEDTLGRMIAAKLGIEVLVSPPFATIPLHHALNRSHEALVPAIDAALQKMVKSGRMRTMLGPFAAMCPEAP